MAESTSSDEDESNHSCPTNLHIFDFKYKRDESLDNLYTCICNELITYLSENKNDTEQSLSSLCSDENVGSITTVHKLLEIKDGVQSAVLNKKYICILRTNGKCSRTLFIKNGIDKRKHLLGNDSKSSSSNAKLKTSMTQQEPSDQGAGIKNEIILHKNVDNVSTILPLPATMQIEGFDEEVFRQIAQDPTSSSSSSNVGSLSYLQTDNTFLPFSLSDNIRIAQNYRLPRYFPYTQRNRQRSNQTQRTIGRGNMIHIPISSSSLFYGNEEPGERSPMQIISHCPPNMQEIPINVVVNSSFPFELSSEIPPNSNDIEPEIIQDQYEYFNTNSIPQFDLEESQMSNSSLLDKLPYETSENSSEKNYLTQSFACKDNVKEELYDILNERSYMKLSNKVLGNEVVCCEVNIIVVYKSCQFKERKDSLSHCLKHFYPYLKLFLLFIMFKS